MNKMFSEIEMARVVALSAKHLDVHSLDRQILRRLLQGLINETACREHGFYLGITALKSICINNHNEYNHPAHILTFRVLFTCRTLLPARGDFLQGIVKRVASNGAFITSGPLRYAYLSVTKMPDYHYVGHSQRMRNRIFRKMISPGLLLELLCDLRCWPCGLRRDHTIEGTMFSFLRHWKATIHLVPYLLQGRMSRICDLL